MNDNKVISFNRVLELWKDGIKEFDDNDYLTLYVNIPYCIEHCSFCLYYRNGYRKKSDLDSYLDLLEIEARGYKSLFYDYAIESLYIGGGTPSLLSVGQIKRLFSILRDNFNIRCSDENFRCFEVHPAYFNKSKIDAVLENNMINRISFGLQSIDKDIIVSNDRNWLSPDKVSRMVEYIQHVSRDYMVNISGDLMIGLKGESYANFLESFKFLARMKIPRIAVYCNRYEARKSKLDFEAKSIKWVTKLNDFVQEHLKDYFLINNSTNFYQESLAWALKSGYESRLFEKSYNSGPIDFNNNIGLGIGASSHIIPSKKVFWKAGDNQYKMQNNSKFDSANTKRSNNGSAKNVYNF